MELHRHLDRTAVYRHCRLTSFRKLVSTPVLRRELKEHVWHPEAILRNHLLKRVPMAPTLEVEDLGAPASHASDAVKALDEKYRIEREKRLNNSTGHFREAKGELARFAVDPWSQEFDRDAVDEDVEVLIVGGGFGGVLAATKLMDSGVDDIRIIDKAGDFGGVWYWNRYEHSSRRRYP